MGILFLYKFGVKTRERPKEDEVFEAGFKA